MKQCACGCGLTTHKRFALGCGRSAATAAAEMVAEPSAPDYTWPWRMPLDALRRLVERDSRLAIQEANNSHLPTP
jgi:hypothetical protein